MDQLYIEEGYIDASYYGIVAEAGANLTGAFTPSFTVDIADASGYYIPDYIDANYFETPGEVVEAYGAFQVISGVGESQSGYESFNISVNAGIIYEMAADFEAFAGSTLVADAFKNHTAILDTTTNMLATASKVASNTITLDSIINQSLQGDRVRFVSFAHSASFDITTAPTAVKDFGASLSSDGGFGLLIVTDAEVSITTTSTMSVSATSFAAVTYPTRNLTPYWFVSSNTYANALTTDPASVNYETTFDNSVVYEGTHSLKPQYGYNYGLVLRSPTAYPGLYVEQDQEFILEFWIYPESYQSDNFISTLGNTKPGNSTLADGTGRSTSKVSVVVGDYNSKSLGGAIVGTWTNSNLAAFIGKASTNSTVAIFTNAQLTTRTWQRIALRRTSNGTIQLLKNNTVIGSTLYSGRLILGSSAGNDLRGGLYSNLNANATNTADRDLYFDNWIFRLNESALTTTTNQSYTQDNVVWHYQFNNSYAETFNAIVSVDATLATSSTFLAVPNRTLDGITIHQSSGTLTANADVVKSAAATITSSASLTATAGFVKEVDTTFESIASELTAINKIANFFVNIDVVSSVTADVNEIVQLECDISSAVTQDTTANYIIDNVVDINTTATIDASVSGGFIGLAPLELTSAFTSVINIDRIRNTASSIDATITSSINAIKVTDVATSIQSNIGTDIVISRIRNVDTTFDSIATELAVAVKIADFFINADVVSIVIVDATKRTGNIVVCEAYGALDATASVIRSANSTVETTATFSVIGTTNITGDADITAVASIIVVANVKAAVTATIASAGGFAISVQATRNDEVDAYITSTLTADVGRIRAAAADIDSAATASINAGILFEVNTSASMQSTMIADGRIIHIQEIVYIVPSELRVFTIQRESRAFTIVNEDRTYDILGA